LDAIIAQQNLKNVVQVDHDGSSISLTFVSVGFFEEGSAKASAHGAPALARVIDMLVKKAKGYPIYVEGHTDDSPIATKVYPSNWELSAARAAMVVREFETRGVPRTLLSAQGFSDTQPIAPNRDAQGNAIPGNQAKNRRVMIKVLKKD
jgi:chemotaxis protein MotB